jgi:CBS domain-containing protein
MSKESMSNESERRIEEIMSKHIVTLDADSSAFDAAKIMSEKNISSLILIDTNKIVGILTERDLIKQICAKDLLSSKAPVTSIMSSPIITINKDLLVKDAARTMIRKRMRHIAVENSAHEIIGMVSTTDLTRFLIDRLEDSSDTLSLVRSLYWQEEPIEESDI